MSLADLTGQKDAYQLLYEAREEIKRLQRQVDRLGKANAKLQKQVSNAAWEANYILGMTDDSSRYQ